jgi:hypothetical protein
MRLAPITIPMPTTNAMVSTTIRPSNRTWASKPSGKRRLRTTPTTRTEIEISGGEDYHAWRVGGGLGHTGHSSPGRSRWDRGLTPADLKRCHWSIRSASSKTSTSSGKGQKSRTRRIDRQTRRFPVRGWQAKRCLDQDQAAPGARVCDSRIHGSGRRRKHFGAMLVGFYEGKKLTFAGRVGTGFNEKLLSSLSAEMNKPGLIQLL